jgi:hypothetical protein
MKVILSSAVDKTLIGEKNDHLKRKKDVRVKNASIFHKSSHYNKMEEK